jgi:hypothetical protein
VPKCSGVQAASKRIVKGGEGALEEVASGYCLAARASFDRTRRVVEPDVVLEEVTMS